MKLKWGCVGLSMIAFIAMSGMANADFPIGGGTPDVRPEGAPVITEVVRGDAWYANALRGVSEPYPKSLLFLDNQGNWYTPFSRPGMLGPYDIRGLHAE